MTAKATGPEQWPSDDARRLMTGGIRARVRRRTRKRHVGQNPLYFFLLDIAKEGTGSFGLVERTTDEILLNVLRNRDNQGWGLEVESRVGWGPDSTLEPANMVCAYCQAKNQLALRVVASIPSRSPSYFEAPPSIPPPIDSHPITSWPNSATTNSTAPTSLCC